MKLSTLTVLSDKEIQAIHNASLDILEHCGVKISSPRMLAFLADRGLDVNSETQIVRFSRTCIELLQAAFSGNLQEQVYGISQLSSTSPLFWEQGALDAIMDTVDTGVPIAVLPEPNAGGSAHCKQRRVPVRTGDDPDAAARNKSDVRQFVDHHRHAYWCGLSRLHRNQPLPRRRRSVGPVLQYTIAYYGSKFRQPRPRRTERLGENLQHLLLSRLRTRSDRQLRDVRHRDDLQPRAVDCGRGDFRDGQTDRRRNSAQPGTVQLVVQRTVPICSRPAHKKG